jgi:hypothetical protein
MDKNDLARFLDGGLSEEEHASAVAHISASDEDAELLADAAAVLRDLDPDSVADDDDADAVPPHADDTDTSSDPKVVPLRPPSTTRARRRLPTRWLALAAMLAGVMLVPLALSRSGGGPGTPAQYAALLAGREAGLPPGWLDQPAWPVTRGGGTPVVDDARAAQLGALHGELELAAAARQAEETALLAARIEALLADVPGAGMTVSNYREIRTRAGQPPEALAELLKAGREEVAMFVDEDHFALGAWAEAARIAAASRDAEFFAARASRKMLDRAREMPLDAKAASAVDAIRAAAGRDGQPDWAVLEAQTRLLLGRLGS